MHHMQVKVGGGRWERCPEGCDATCEGTTILEALEMRDELNDNEQQQGRTDQYRVVNDEGEVLEYRTAEVDA